MTGPGDFYETEVRIQARPETVFGFLVDPARMVQWMGLDAALDPRPGGSFRINVLAGDTALGEYVEVKPYERIVMTWGWEGGPIAPGSTRLEFDLIPDGEATVLRLRHFGLDEDGTRSHAEGWTHYLARLVLAAAGRDPGPDPWAQAAPN